MDTKTLRLDVQLVERGLLPSREKAKEAIAAGAVLVDNKPASKPSQTILPANKLEVLPHESLKYVSRGGLKLEKALKVFEIPLEGAICVDVGASTGGFTQCMLEHGAAHVVAIDVGHEQLHPTLVHDDRVTNLEGCDARDADPYSLYANGMFDLVATDVSFISLEYIMPALARLSQKPLAHVVCLIKPQFEAGREHVGKNGIVKDPKIHREVIERVCGYARANGLEPCGLDYSPITGTKGNIEYLLYMQKPADTAPFDTCLIAEIVTLAHKNLPR
ncbi:MAG: TlyA family RNA methyltransferase [Coriobacteriales bacterium]|nr:TlyA family RNA methyltransferase [Coriobacteriales bacterium]